MELLQLRYFSALAHKGNLTKTAHQLYISPSSLSLTISRLEKELGVKLFDRVGKQILLNEVGQQFLKRVDIALEQLDEGLEELSNHSAQGRNQLAVAVTSPKVWLDLFSAFMEEHPEAIISHSVLRLQDLSDIRSLRPYDVLITAVSDVTSLNMDGVMLYKDDAPVLLVPQDHSLAQCDGVRMEDLREEAFVCLSKEYSARKYFDDLCKLVGFTPKIAVECDFSLREIMVLNHKGIAIMAPHFSRIKIPKGICAVQVISPFFPREMGLFYQKNTPLSPLAEQFKQFAVDYCRQPPKRKKRTEKKSTQI